MRKEKKATEQEVPITIGEVAKKLGVTVRTLQYYDKEGILTPSATSDGGRRFYTKSDIVKLHQILTMKYLGFSLETIKEQLVHMKSPQDVSHALELQKRMFQEQIEQLKEALADTEILQQEVQQMQTVDFDRYASIIMMLRQKSDSYWLFKLFNEKIATHVKELFYDDLEGWARLYSRWEAACDQSILLEQQGIAPESEKAQLLAKEWWDITQIFTGGDESLLPELKKFEENSSNWGGTMKDKIAFAKTYRNKILSIYLKKDKP